MNHRHAGSLTRFAGAPSRREPKGGDFLVRPPPGGGSVRRTVGENAGIDRGTFCKVKSIFLSESSISEPNGKTISFVIDFVGKNLCTISGIIGFHQNSTFFQSRVGGEILNLLAPLGGKLPPSLPLPNSRATCRDFKRLPITANRKATQPGWLFYWRRWRDIEPPRSARWQVAPKSAAPQLTGNLQRLQAAPRHSQ